MFKSKNGSDVLICPHCGAKLPDGLQVCFRCGEPLNAAPPPPEQHTYVAERAYAKPARKPRGKIAAVIAIVIVLAIGAAAGGHYMGLYELPYLPEIDLKVQSETEASDVEKASPRDDDGEKAGQQEADEEPQADEIEQPEAEAPAEKGEPTAVYDLPNLSFTVYSDGSASAELSAYRAPDWVFERQEKTEDSPTMGMIWSVFFASDSTNLYLVSGHRPHAGNMESFDEISYSVSPYLGCAVLPDYNGYYMTGLEGGITNLDKDSIAWEFVARGSDDFDVIADLSNLTFLGYEVIEQNEETVYRSFALQNGEWADLGELSPFEYFIAQNME